MTPLDVARTFVDRINARDVDGLAALMTDDHRFVDSLGRVMAGREVMRAGWAGYFQMVSDYTLEPAEWFTDGQVVVLVGTAGGTYSPDGVGGHDGRWQTPAACRAVIRDGRVAEWSVYADNEPIRALMRQAAG
jgi:ketosteroid isomerase-like protein